ncbi:GNAT family N-acetyltransferase [Viridibacillus arvi]|uniref:N-acetyltransferase domain-containing protein n=1 Tax=Viridibacillus arvi TaxID=263475 RepID=A0A0M0L9R8_9BACL|nr:GNAT family N-acetyltransferase [Viridibacillus arvi]KOO47388.1 hypothetical protein AMD00_22270 [Viridibacillus arvi]
MAWKEQTFDELTTTDLYRILQLRINVFVVEQKAYYADLDDHDQNCVHVTYEKDGKLIAYARIVPPGEKFEMASFGRVIVLPEARGTGLSQELIKRVMAILERNWPEADLFIEAQAYLQKFYGAFGFEAVSEEYIMECLPHIDMVCKRKK